MNQSILISGGKFSERYQKACDLATTFLGNKKMVLALKSHPDFREVTVDLATGISIAQIRDLIKTLFLRPIVAPTRVVVIPQAELLTVEAQNAFLKTLEEPPSQAVIILCCRDPGMLLPTIVSRCRLLKLKQKPEVEVTKSEEKELSLVLEKILSSSLGQKFALAESLGKGRDETLALVDKLAIIAHTNLIQGVLSKTKNIAKYQKFLSQIPKTKNQINANVNPRFALENLFLSC